MIEEKKVMPAAGHSTKRERINQLNYSIKESIKGCFCLREAVELRNEGKEHAMKKNCEILWNGVGPRRGGLRPHNPAIHKETSSPPISFHSPIINSMGVELN